MPAAVIRDFEEKIRTLIEDEDLETDEVDLVFRQVHRLRKKNEFLPPSLHFNVTDGDTGKRLHLRVLIWQSTVWHDLRRACLDQQAQLHQLVTSRRLSFQVPDVVRSGEDPLLWDLTVFANAANLPWQFDENQGQTQKHNLDTHLAKVPKFFKIASEFATLKPKNVPTRDFTGFAGQLSSWATWTRQFGILGADEALLVRETAHEYMNNWFDPRQVVLVHADFGPNNVLFPARAKPWLVDFDHLRYSVIGDGTARLATVSYSEKAWTERVLKTARRVHSEDEWNGFVVMSMWHSINTWRQYFRLFSPVRGLRHLDELSEIRPRYARQIAAQRKLLRQIMHD